MDRDLRYNASGYRDPVAEKAIKSADHTPYAVGELCEVIRKIAGAYGYEVVGRIAFRDRQTNKVYR